MTPVAFDWDADGDLDLVCGNTAGYIGWIENLDGACPASGRREVGGGRRAADPHPGRRTSRSRALRGEVGFHAERGGQDLDGLPDRSSIRSGAKVVWFRNTGTRPSPRFAAAAPVEVAWPGRPPKPAWTWWEPRPGELAAQWRTTPVVIDWNEDGLPDLVMLDHEGYLALFPRAKRDGKLVLLPPERVFVDAEGAPLRLNAREAGGSGRRKLCFADWDGDGRLDLLANSVNVDFFRNLGRKEGKTVLANQGAVDSRRLAGHTTSPTVVDWNRDGLPDLVIGAEDGYLYYLGNPRAKSGR